MLKGNSGKDRISGGSGADRISGGSGSDRIAARDGRRDRVGCGSGRDRVVADRKDRVARTCERVRRAGSRPTARSRSGARAAAAYRWSAGRLAGALVALASARDGRW